MTPDAELAILQALMEDAFKQVMAEHGTILTDNFAEVVTKDIPALAKQIAEAIGQAVLARENGAPESDVWPHIEHCADTLESRFYGATATKLRELGREALMTTRGASVGN